MSNKRKHENQLQAAFDFTSEDLQYNRDLALSPAQHRIRTRSRLRQLSDMLPAWVSISTVIVVSLFMIVTATYLISQMPVNTIIGILFIIVSVLIMVGYAVYEGYYHPHQTAFSQPPAHRSTRISTIQGQIELYRTIRQNAWGGQQNQCCVRVNNYEFHLSDAQFMALRHAHTYRFYYIPASNHILSVEAIASP